MFYMGHPIKFMNGKFTFIGSILIALLFLFLSPSVSFSQQENANLPGEISHGTGVEDKNERAPVLEIIEKESLENIEIESQPNSLTQEQENKLAENNTSDNSSKSKEGDKREYDEKIRRIELLSIAITVLFVVSLLLNVYIFAKARKK